MRNIVVFIFFTTVLSFQVFAEMPVVTVLDFQMNAVSESDMKSITSFLSASLHDTGKYTVIDTAQRDTILAELAFSNSGCTDESCQLEIGELLSAEFIVTGDIALVGGRYILSARMLKTETSATINTAKGIYTDLSGLIDDMPIFAAELSGDTVDRSETVIAELDEGSANGLEVAAWSTLGAGAIAAGVGGYLMYSVLDYKKTVVDPSYDAYKISDISTSETSIVDSYNTLWTDYESKYEEFNKRMLYSSIIAGAGVVSMVVSLVLFIINSPEESDFTEDTTENVTFMIMPAPDAATLSCRIRM